MTPRSRLLAVLSLFCLSGSVAAWGPVTNKFICHEAVKFVWGVDAVGQCLPMTDKAFLNVFCETSYRVMGAEYENKCKAAVEAGVDMHPSLVSYDVFKDTENHADYSSCPVSTGTARPWVCGDGKRPAYTVSEKWMKEAESAPDLCSRVYDFCLAASYYADSESKLHHVRFVSNDCVENIEESIDRSIEAGTQDWSASQLCRFNNLIKGLGNLYYQERMGESSSTVNKIITNLTLRGLQIKPLPYRPSKGVVLLANSIDSAGASELPEYLKSGGVNVINSAPSDFDRLKYNARIIILGGQNSPEGIGAISASVLSQEDEASLLMPGAGSMFIKSGEWTEGQKVIVLAGNEAEDTKRAWSDNRQRILEEVR